MADRTWKPSAVPAPAPAPVAPAAPAPANLVEAKEQGIALSPGVQITAPLAPKSGPIPGNSGDFVVSVLKNFWESPTIQKLRNAVVAAVTVAIGIVTTQVIVAQGDLWAVNWQLTEKAAIAAAAFSLASAYGAWLKVHDNDPIKDGTKPPEQGR